MPVIKVKDLAFGRAALAGSRPGGGVPHPLRHDPGGAHADGALHAGNRRGPPSARDRAGRPGFVGLAYYAPSDEDLQRVAKAPGASAVEAIDEPGGGRRVRLREPNGYQIEVVHGIEALPPITVPAPAHEHRQPSRCGARAR